MATDHALSSDSSGSEESSEEAVSKQKPKLNTHQNKCTPSNPPPKIYEDDCEADEDSGSQENETDDDLEDNNKVLGLNQKSLNRLENKSNPPPKIYEDENDCHGDEDSGSQENETDDDLEDNNEVQGLNQKYLNPLENKSNPPPKIYEDDCEGDEDSGSQENETDDDLGDNNKVLGLNQKYLNLLENKSNPPPKIYEDDCEGDEDSGSQENETDDDLEDSNKVLGLNQKYLNLLENKSNPPPKIYEDDCDGDEDSGSQEDETDDDNKGEGPNQNLLENKSNPPPKLATPAKADENKEVVDTTHYDESSEDEDSKEKPNLNLNNNKPMPCNPPVAKIKVRNEQQEEDESDEEDGRDKTVDDSEHDEDGDGRNEVEDLKLKLNLLENKSAPCNPPPAKADENKEIDTTNDDEKSEDSKEKPNINLKNNKLAPCNPPVAEIKVRNDDSSSEQEEDDESDDDEESSSNSEDESDDDKSSKEDDDDDDNDSSSEDDDSEDSENEDDHKEEYIKQKPKLNNMQNKADPTNQAPELATQPTIVAAVDEDRDKKSGENFGSEEENEDQEVEETDDDDRPQEENSKKTMRLNKPIANPNQGITNKEADVAEQINKNKNPSLHSSLIPTSAASKAPDEEGGDDNSCSEQGNEDEESEEKYSKQKQMKATHLLNPNQDGNKQEEQEDDDSGSEKENKDEEVGEANDTEKIQKKNQNDTYLSKTTPSCASRTSVPSKAQNREEEHDDSASEEENDDSCSEEEGEEVNKTPQINEEKKSSSSDKVKNKSKAYEFEASLPIVALKRTSDSKEATDSVDLPPKKKSKLAIEGGNNLKLKGNKVWSLDDKVSILKGMIRFNEKEGSYPNSKTMAKFLEFINDSITPGHTKDQLSNKVRKLKQAYKSNARKGDTTFLSTPQDRKCFKLSKTIWADNAIVASPGSNYNSKRRVEGKIVGAKCGEERSKIGALILNEKLVDLANVEGASLDPKVFWDKFPRFQAFMDLELSGMSEVEKKAEMKSMINIGNEKASEIEDTLKSNLAKKIKLDMEQLEVDKERKDIHTQIKLLRLNLIMTPNALDTRTTTLRICH